MNCTKKVNIKIVSSSGEGIDLNKYLKDLNKDVN